MVRLIFTAIVLVLLTACSNVRLEPSSRLVQREIALQVEQTQQQLSQQLSLDVFGFEINRVAVTKQEPLMIHLAPLNQWSNPDRCQFKVGYCLKSRKDFLS